MLALTTIGLAKVPTDPLSAVSEASPASKERVRSVPRASMMAFCAVSPTKPGEYTSAIRMSPVWVIQMPSWARATKVALLAVPPPVSVMVTGLSKVPMLPLAASKMALWPWMTESLVLDALSTEPLTLMRISPLPMTFSRLASPPLG